MNGASASVSAAAARRAVLLLTVGYLLVGYATLSSGHAWGDDWAQYVAHARNLALGHAYSSTGYVFNPSAPHVGPPVYSPGLPLLLAPVIRLFGVDIIALKSVSLVCMTAAILLTFMLYRDALGAWVAAGAAFVFGLHDFAWGLREYIASEPPYIVWTLAALYCASRPVRGRGLATGLACGLFAYAAFATRPIGFSLIVATLLYEIAQRRFLSARFLAIAGVPAIGIVLQKHFLTFADYSAELHVPAWHELAANVIGYWKALGSLFPLGGKLSLLSPIPIVGLVAIGIGYRLRRHDAQARSGSPLSYLLEQIPVDVWYLVLYCGALVVLPFETNARYLFPVLPIAGAYVVYALSRLLAPLQQRRPAIAVIAATCLAYYGALHWLHDRAQPGEDALCDDCRAMYSYLRDNTESNALVAFAKPRVIALLAGRRGWTWAADRARESNWQEMMRAGVNYMVLVPPNHPLASQYPLYLSWDTWRADPHLTLVFENRTFRVLRLNYVFPVHVEQEPSSVPVRLRDSPLPARGAVRKTRFEVLPDTLAVS